MNELVIGMRGFLAVAAASTITTLMPAAHAQDTKARCLVDHEQAQIHHQQGEYLAERDKLRACAQHSCPSVVQSDCIGWLENLEKIIPSIVLKAWDNAGDIFDVQVTIDGKPLAARLQGQAIEVDPGPHLLRFESKGRPPQEQRVLLQEGEKNRVVTANWETPRSTVPAAAAPVAQKQAVPKERPVPLSVYILAGVGVAGIGTFTYLGLTGKSRESDLRNSCAPFCKDDDVDSLSTRFHIGDAGLAIGVVAFGAGAIAYLLRPEVPSPPNAETPTARSNGRLTNVAVYPLRGGAMAGWQAHF